MADISSDTKYTTGTILAVTEKSDGEYTVSQVGSQDRVPKVPEGNDSVKAFSYSIGPLTISGNIDLSTFGISIEASVLGISIGSFSGNLKDGLKISINIYAAKGEIRLYLKNGNEVWLGLDLKIIFGKHWQEDVKVITI